MQQNCEAGDAERAEPLDDIGVGPFDVADNDRHHASSSIAIGNNRWYASP
jgi:hypothetical protein